MGEDFDINSAIDTVAESMNIGKEESDEPILDDTTFNAICRHWYSALEITSD